MKRRKKIRIIAFGGLGDILLSTPALAALKRKDPSCRIVVFCGKPMYRPIYKGNPNIDRLTSISFASNPIDYISYYFKWRKYYFFRYWQVVPSLFYQTRASEIIGEMLDVHPESLKMEVYLTKEEDETAKKEMQKYRNPIIIHPSSKTSKNQEWPLEYWESLIKEMPDYTFIQLGIPENAKVNGAVDLRGKIPVREAMALVKYSMSFVGVNSFFSHVTNAFDIPGVVIFGASNPEIWGQPNNINLYNKLRCSPCIDLVSNNPCPYGVPCMKGVVVEDVKQALLTQLEKSTSHMDSKRHYINSSTASVSV